MIITKYGHCCMLIQENGMRVLTDPGKFSTQQDTIMNINAILITHEHADHFHIESVKNILRNNPHVIIITNTAVGLLLTKENIPYTPVEHMQNVMLGDLKIEGYGMEHATIFPGLPIAMNTGYFIGERFFYPGDAFVIPGRPVDILALPVAGPWMKFSEAIDYAQKIKPSICVPVHDGILKIPDMMHPVMTKILEQTGIRFVELPIDVALEI